jgi:hypothetical protein
VIEPTSLNEEKIVIHRLEDNIGVGCGWEEWVDVGTVSHGDKCQVIEEEDVRSERDIMF